MLEIVMTIALFGVCAGYILWKSVLRDMDLFGKDNENVDSFERTEFIDLPDGRLYEVEKGKASLVSVSK